MPSHVCPVFFKRAANFGIGRSRQRTPADHHQIHAAQLALVGTETFPNKPFDAIARDRRGCHLTRNAHTQPRVAELIRSREYTHTAITATEIPGEYTSVLRG